MINYNHIFAQEARTFQAYRKLIDELLAQGQTTGTDNSEDMLHYAKMNVQRMNRVDKTCVLNNDLVQTIQSLPTKYKLLVISEGWCGDAAQIVPVLHKIAETAGSDKLELHVVLRDKNLPLIDAHLTNGGRAIPVLLILDSDGNVVLPKWGPRPQILQELIKTWKQEGIEMPELGEKLHGWYAKDKTQSTQAELNDYLKQLI